jgi:hypothetical protein
VLGNRDDGAFTARCWDGAAQTCALSCVPDKARTYFGPTSHPPLVGQSRPSTKTAIYVKTVYILHARPRLFVLCSYSLTRLSVTPRTGSNLQVTAIVYRDSFNLHYMSCVVSTSTSAPYSLHSAHVGIMSRTPYAYQSSAQALPPRGQPTGARRAVPAHSHPSQQYPQNAQHRQSPEHHYYRSSPGPSQPRQYQACDPLHSERTFPPTPSSSVTSHVFAFRPPPNPAYSARPIPRRPSMPTASDLPADIAVSPFKPIYPSYPQSDFRPRSPGSFQHPRGRPPGEGEDNDEDKDASSGEGTETGETQKLEVKREVSWSCPRP